MAGESGAVGASGAAPGSGGGRTVHHRDRSEIEFGRIVNFTDGVFAIAITLLVLALEVPDGADLLDELAARDNHLFAYALSFAVLARLWFAHHRFYAAVERFDAPLIGLNFTYLAFVALVPFASEVLGDYGDEAAGVVLYAADMTAITIAFGCQVLYAYRSGLIRPEARELQRRFAGPANFAIAAVFALSIPVAFVSPLAASILWLAVFLVGRRLGDLLAGQRAPR